MSMRKRSVGLIAFLKGNSDPAVDMPGCANYDHYYGGCLFAETCLVEKGKRCGYFERAVLPTAEGIGLKELVYSLYERQVGIAGIGQFDSGEIRRCPDCGAELKPRQRYCDECSKKRRQKTRRESQRKYRKKKRGST